MIKVEYAGKIRPTNERFFAKFALLIIKKNIYSSEKYRIDIDKQKGKNIYIKHIHIYQ